MIADYETDMALAAMAYGVADQKVGAKDIRRMDGLGTRVQEPTPGPWVLADEYNPSLARHDYHFIHAGRGYPDENGHGFGISGVMSLANARLIAAAPDLYAALKTIVHNYDTGNYTAIDMPAAREALAKVTATPTTSARGE